MMVIDECILIGLLKQNSASKEDDWTAMMTQNVRVREGWVFKLSLVVHDVFPVAVYYCSEPMLQGFFIRDFETLKKTLCDWPLITIFIISYYSQLRFFDYPHSEPQLEMVFRLL